MFKNANEFETWISAHADLGFAHAVQHQPDNVVTDLKKVFNRYGKAQGDYSMLQVARLLGLSIPEFVKIADQATGLSEADRDEFVVAGAIALFRLLDLGKSGSESNILGDRAGNDVTAFPDTQSIEDAFVRPLAEGAILEANRIFDRNEKRIAEYQN